MDDMKGKSVRVTHDPDLVRKARDCHTIFFFPPPDFPNILLLVFFINNIPHVIQNGGIFK